MTAFITPFLIGLAGSLHCISMCGPLAMAVTRYGKGSVERNLVYNGGRVLTYALLGSMFAYMGKGFALAGIHEWVSFVTGVMIVAVGIAGTHLLLPSWSSRYLLSFSAMLKSWFRMSLSARGPLSSLLLGMINGILPCGMTLLGLAYCATLTQPTDGFIAMVFFGLGTLPVMTGGVMVIRSLIAKSSLGYRRIQTILLIVAGVLLIARGVEAIGDGSHESHAASIVTCGPTTPINAPHSIE